MCICIYIYIYIYLFIYSSIDAAGPADLVVGDAAAQRRDPPPSHMYITVYRSSCRALLRDSNSIPNSLKGRRHTSYGTHLRRCNM